MNDLNECQQKGLAALESRRNVFLTGAAGTGKSHLTRHFLKGKSHFTFPVVASTGAAALIIGGRTFHSFFGLGTMSGNRERIVSEAMAKDKVVSRLQRARGVLIDEISMIDTPTLDAAEEIARRARVYSDGKIGEKPWGGLQIVAVGDFRQLPPVSRSGEGKQWCFQSEAWRAANFYPVMLKTPMRSVDPDFLAVLNYVRAGQTPPIVQAFLDSRMVEGAATPNDVTRLFGRRVDVERYNLDRLAELPGEERSYPTVYWGATSSYEDQIRKNAPIPVELRLKVGALVMIRKNDPDLRWVNGSMGWIKHMDITTIVVELLTGDTITLEEEEFTHKNGDGDTVAMASNFPLNLGWATTIHKSQGCTLDKLLVDLNDLWEPGHAYVALSRVRSPEGLFISNWSPASIKSDPLVTEFHRRLFP